jgi:hypothetical protein
MIGVQVESIVKWCSCKKRGFLHRMDSALPDMNGVHEVPILSEEVTSMACGKKCGTKATAKKKTAKKK